MKIDEIELFLNNGFVYINACKFDECFSRYNRRVLRSRPRTYNDLDRDSWLSLRKWIIELSRFDNTPDIKIEKLIDEFWGYYDHEQLELYKKVLTKHHLQV